MIRCLGKTACLSARLHNYEVCCHKRCEITTEEELVLSQDLTIWWATSGNLRSSANLCPTPDSGREMPIAASAKS